MTSGPTTPGALPPAGVRAATAMLTLGEVVRRQAQPETCGPKPALIQGGERVTYAELFARVNRTARALLRLGVQKGDRVGLLGRNSIEYAVAYFALARIGAIVVPVNFWYRGEEVRYACAQSGCSALLAEAGFADLVEGVRGQLPDVRRSVYFGAGAERRGPSLAELAAAEPADEPPVAVGEDDPSVIIFTSGTTGFPKGATFTHRRQVLHSTVFALETGLAERDVALLIYPLFHVGGVDCLLLPALIAGSTVVVMDRPEPRDVLLAIEGTRATFVFCVPTVWRRLVRELEAAPRDVSSVRICLSSSDTITRDTLVAIKEHFGAPVIQLYGLTEACVVTHFLKPEHHESRLGSVGRPHPFVDVRLVDEVGRDVPPGEVGQILMRGPTVMAGYWNMPDRTAEAIRDGWLHSGDLGRVDEDGFLYIMGRAKDMIVSGGENIYPAAIERVLREHPEVQDAAVVGLPDPEWGEAVCAVVVPREGARPEPAGIAAFVRERLAGYNRPKHVVLADALPVTTATGKVQKAELRRRYAHLAARAPGVAP
jgi:fatty-acyl-CoA synthase